MAGGKSKSVVYNEKLLAVARRTGLLVGIVLVAYDVLIYLDFEVHPAGYRSWIAIALAVAYMALGLAQYIMKPHTKKMIMLVSMAYYILIAIWTTTMSGDSVATFIFWLILLIATDALLGVKSLLYGSSFMFATMILYCSLQPNLSSATLLNVATSTVLAIGVAMFISWIRSANIVKYDIFEQTKAREKIQRQRLSTVINSISDAIISTSSSGYVRIYNAAALNLLDTNASLTGKRIDDILQLYDQNGKPVSIHETARGTQKPIERDDLSYRFDDGQEIRLDISIAPVRSAFGDAKAPGTGGLILILRDITKSKSLEEERDEFISVVSHELRTPITIAEGTISNIQFLVDRGGEPKMLNQALNDAHEQIMFLARMVNDLSTLSRAERGIGMEPEIIGVREFMETLYNKYLSTAMDKKLQLNLDVEPNLGKVNVSRLCIEEVMQNIVINAIKYTNTGSVDLIAKKTTGDKIHFAVKDSGIGISKTDQKNVFNRFWRSEDYRTRETSGTGLGLHITRRLAKKMGTEITLISRLNHGSTFGFDLPSYHESAKKPEKPRAK